MNLLCLAISLFILLTLVVGAAGSPLLTTGLAQWWFPVQANGSLVMPEGKVRGSALIGQSFIRPDYFQRRPSTMADSLYNALASSIGEPVVNVLAFNMALDAVPKP